MVEIRQLHATEGRKHVSTLADVLLDCVRGGASVGFLAALTKTEAEAFFAKVFDAVERRERILLAAFLDGKLVGTVQIVPAPFPNQPHRADVAKLLVHRSARRQGIAKLLMQSLEVASLRAGRTLLVLDTVTGSAAEKLYLSLGWNRAGLVPRYALFPDGRFCDTMFFWKQLA